MRKKDKRNLIIGLVVVVGIILLAIFLSRPLSIGGTSTLSLSKASLESTNSYLSGDVWILTFSANSLGQSYFGDFTPEDVEDETSGELRTEHDFTVEVEYDDTQCKYPIKGSSLDPIKDIRLVEWTYVPFASPCESSEANERGLNNVELYGRYFKNIVVPTCFAIGYDTKSVVKRIDNPDVSADYTITIEADGKTASETFNTLEGKTSGPIGSFAYSVWNGNFDTGKSCPSQDNYLGAYVNGNWRIIDEDDYEDYDNAYEDLQRFTNSDADRDKITRTVEDVQDYAGRAKSSVSFGTIENAGSLSNGRVILDATTPLQFPVTTLYIKASTLGVYTPVPDFKITSATSTCFKTGTEGQIIFELKNSGETGGFTAYADCGGVFSATRNVQGTVDEDETKKFSIPLSATASSKQTGTCTLRIESTGDTETKSVEVCVQPQVTCDVEPGKKFCGYENGAEVVKTCTDSGQSEIVETCSSTQECSNGKCVAKGTGGGFFGGIWDGIKDFFSDLFGGVFDFLTIIKYILIAVGTIVAFMGSTGLLQYLGDRFRFKPFRNYPWLIYVIASIISIAVAYLLYVFIGSFWFWIMVIAIVIYNFFFSQLNLFINLRKAGKRAIRRR